jgi:hypothetical protein
MASAPPSGSSFLIDDDHVIVRSEPGPGLRDLALDREHAQQPLTIIGTDVAPVQRTGPRESVGEQDRNIDRRRS